MDRMPTGFKLDQLSELATANRSIVGTIRSARLAITTRAAGDAEETVLGGLVGVQSTGVLIMNLEKLVVE